MSFATESDHSESPVAGTRLFTCTDSIHQGFEFRAYSLWKSGCESLVQWDQANEVFYISNIPAATAVIQTAEKFNRDQVMQFDNAHAINGRIALDLHSSFLRADGVNAYTIKDMFPVFLVPYSTSGF